MDNIIAVDFNSGKVRNDLYSQREIYLNLVAAELDELDFEDFVDAVNDPETNYTNLDDDMKQIVDGFFACPA